MKLIVLDANGNPQTILTAAQEAVVDSSGTIVTTNIAQNALQPNANRSGWFIRNKGTHPMAVNEMAAASLTDSGSYILQPGDIFPPVGYPLSLGALSIVGTSGDAYLCREW